MPKPRAISFVRFGKILIALIIVFSMFAMVPMPSKAALTQVGKIIIENQGTTDLVDTAVRVEITDANFFAYLDETHIRIQDFVGNDIPFWIEKWDSENQEAVIWLKVSVSAGSSKAYYVYYDDTLTGSLSNGNNVFIAFDDFEGTSLDSEKWSIDVDNSNYIIEPSTDHAYSGSKSLKIYDPSTGRARIKFNNPELFTQGYVMKIMFYDIPNQGGTEAQIFESSTQTKGIMIGVNEGINANKYVYREGTSWYSTSITRAEGWHELKYIHKGGSLEAYIDNTLIHTFSISGSITTIQVGGSWGTETSTLYWDTFIITKYYDESSLYIMYQDLTGGSSPTPTPTSTESPTPTPSQTLDCTLNIDFTDSSNSIPTGVVTIDWDIEIYDMSGNLVSSESNSQLTASISRTYSLDFSTSSYYIIDVLVTYHYGLPGDGIKTETQYESPDGSQSSTSVSFEVYSYHHYFSESETSRSWKPLVDGNIDQDPPEQPPDTGTSYTAEFKVWLKDASGDYFFPDDWTIDHVTVSLTVKTSSGATVATKSTTLYASSYTDNVQYTFYSVTDLNDNNDPHTAQVTLTIYYKDETSQSYSTSASFSIDTSDYLTSVNLYPVSADWKKATLSVEVKDSTGSGVTASVYIKSSDGTTTYKTGTYDAINPYTTTIWSSHDYIIEVYAQDINYQDSQTLTATTIESNAGQTISMVFQATGEEQTLPDYVIYDLTILFKDKGGVSLDMLQSCNPTEYGITIYDRNGNIITTWSGLSTEYSTGALQISKDAYPLQIYASATFKLHNIDVKVVKKIVPLSFTQTIYVFDNLQEHYVKISVNDIRFRFIDDAQVQVFLDTSRTLEFYAVYDLSGGLSVATLSSGDSIWLPEFLAFKAKGIASGYTAIREFIPLEAFDFVNVTINAYYVKVTYEISLNDVKGNSPFDISEITATDIRMQVFYPGGITSEWTLGQSSTTIVDTRYLQRYGVFVASFYITLTYTINGQTASYYMTKDYDFSGEYIYMRPLEDFSIKPKYYVITVTDVNDNPVSSILVKAWSTAGKSPWSQTGGEEVVWFNGYTNALGKASFYVPPMAWIQLQVGYERLQESIAITESEDTVIITWKLVTDTSGLTVIMVDLLDANGLPAIYSSILNSLSVEVSYITNAGVAKTVTRDVKASGVILNDPTTANPYSSLVHIVLTDARPESTITINVKAIYMLGSEILQKTYSYTYTAGQEIFIRPFVTKKLSDATYTILLSNTTYAKVDIYAVDADSSELRELLSRYGGEYLFKSIDVYGTAAVSLPSGFVYEVRSGNATATLVEYGKTVIVPQTQEYSPVTSSSLAKTFGMIFAPSVIAIILALWLSHEYASGFGALGFAIVFVLIITAFSVIGLLPVWVAGLIGIISAGILAYVISGVARGGH